VETQKRRLWNIIPLILVGITSIALIGIFSAGADGAGQDGEFTVEGTSDPDATPILSPDDSAATTSAQAMMTIMAPTETPPLPTPKPVIMGMQFAIYLGQTGVLEDGTVITFDSVIEDSRCPRDVECDTQGQVIVTLTIARHGDPQSITITQQSEASVIEAVDSYYIELISLRPAPESNRTVTPELYRVQLVVTRP
jgi:hypothetical protein